MFCPRHRHPLRGLVNPNRCLLAGGFVIRGTVSKTVKSGDEFITLLDHQLAKYSLAGKLTVHYTNFTLFASPDEVVDNPNFDPDSRPPILYVTGPDLVRPSRPIQLSLVSMLGVATPCYFSIYPFLFNPTLAQRVDDQLALANANMTPDSTFLTELSLPLFSPIFFCYWHTSQDMQWRRRYMGYVANIHIR